MSNVNAISLIVVKKSNRLKLKFFLKIKQVK